MNSDQMLTKPNSVDAVNIELILDGGSNVNWKINKKVQGLELQSLEQKSDRFFFPSKSDDSISYGTIDLNGLPVSEYEITLPGDSLTIDLENKGQYGPIGTQNTARASHQSWLVKSSQSGKVILEPTSELNLETAVLSLDAAMGVVSIVTGPVITEECRIVLRNRKDKKKKISVQASSFDGMRCEFFLSTPVWKETEVPIDQGKSIWDLFVETESKGEQITRLRWQGSNTSNPRETVRLRATQSWAVSGELYKIRPYWTLDQYLALEISRYSNRERS